MSHVVRDMYDYHVWANNVLFNRLKEFPAEIVGQETQSAFPTITKTLAHIYVADAIWLDILNRMEPKEVFAKGERLQEDLQSISLGEMESLFAELTGRYQTFFEQNQDLEQKMALDNPYVGVKELTLAQMVLHVVNHGSYHRGNIGTMLRQLGHTSVMTDYIVYLYSDLISPTGVKLDK